MSLGPKHWNILLVDDEPDVLRVSELAMRDFTVDNLPINILTATSKAEALNMIEQEETWISHLAVAFIDVVMESDTAGLELCQYIREKKKNRVSQLYIRTGQPGVAPERAVIDRYDISGYFTKAEMTEDKLYSLVKSGVRQFYAVQVLQASLMMLEQLVEIGDSKEKLMGALQKLGQGFYPPHAPDDNAVLFTINGEPVVGPLGWDMETAVSFKETLDATEGVSLSADGDKCVHGKDGALMIKVAATDTRPEVVNLLQYQNRLSESRIRTIHSFSRTLATLWARSG